MMNPDYLFSNSDLEMEVAEFAFFRVIGLGWIVERPRRGLSTIHFPILKGS